MKEEEPIFTDRNGLEWFMSPIYRKGQTDYRMLASVEKDDEGRRVWKKMSTDEIDRITEIRNELNERAR